MIPILYSSSSVVVPVVPTSFGIGALTDCIRYEVQEERNGKYEVTLVYPANGIHADQIQYGSFIKAKPNFTDDPQLFQVYKIGKTMNGQFTVYCQHVSYLLSGKVITSGTAGSCTAACTLLTASAGGFTINTDKNVSADFNITEPSSVRSWFGGKAGSLLDVYGTAEWHYDNFTCSLKAHRGEDRGVQIRYGKNLTQLSQEISMENLCTGIIPFCIDETKTKTVGTRVATGLILDFDRDKAVDFSDDVDFESATPLLTQLATLASNYIANNNFTDVFNSITLDFVQLSDLTERVDLCDTVHIYFEALGITASLKCVATTWDGLNERYIACTFGDMRTSIADTIVNQQKEVADKPSVSEMGKAIDTATKLITGNLGGYVVMHDSDNDGEPDEILIMDTPDISTATNVIRMNQSGIGLSTTGYVGPYTTALTASGIVADAITTGVLNANLIKAGVIEDLAQNSQIDMTTGVATLYELAAKAYSRVIDAVTLDVLAEVVAGSYGGGIRLFNRNNKTTFRVQCDSNSNPNLQLFDASGNERLHAFVGGTNDDGIVDLMDGSDNVTISLVGQTGAVECNNVKPKNSQWVEVWSSPYSSGYSMFDYDQYNTFLIMAKVTSTSSYNEITIPKCMLEQDVDKKFCISDDDHYVVIKVREHTQLGHNYVMVTFDSRDSSGSIEKIYASYT